MPWFSGRSQPPRGPLPSDIVPLMDMFGRSEFDARETGIARGIDTSRRGSLEAELYPASQADPDAFVTYLATAVLPVGGWATYGASRLIASLLGLDYAHPASDEIRTAALQWLRANGVPPMRVAPYEWEFWQQHGGQTEPWLPTRPGYHPEDAPITDLAIGEMRRVARIMPDADSNVVYVRRNDESVYAVVVEGPYSDEDPRQSQWETTRAETLRDLYTEMGAGLQMLPYWCDSELEAFIPYGRPRIPVL